MVALVDSLPGCAGRCLVWAKSDALVAAVKQLAPRLPVGYVVLNESAQVRGLGCPQAALRLAARRRRALAARGCGSRPWRLRHCCGVLWGRAGGQASPGGSRLQSCN